jgi:hypothetical protein
VGTIFIKVSSVNDSNESEVPEGHYVVCRTSSDPVENGKVVIVVIDYHQNDDAKG